MRTEQAEVTAEMSTKIKSGGRSMTVFGIISIVFGIAAILTPAMTGLSVVITVGLLMMAGGITRMLWAFAAENFGRGVLVFMIGGLTLLCGLSMVTDPLIASGFLTILIAALLSAEGVAEIVAAFNIPSGRGWMLLGGIASILLGIMIWRQFPLSGAWAIGVLLGIKLLMIGIVILAVGSAGQSLARNMTTPR